MKKRRRIDKEKKNGSVLALGGGQTTPKGHVGSSATPWANSL
jgi:hypothetical protein